MQVGYNSLGSITSTDVLYLHTDHLDTPRLATNASQTVVWKLPPHEPFGTAQAQQDPDQDGIATDIPLRFAGQVFDADTGLHYNYFRDYDPWTGRYIQSDPIGLEGGVNTYGYVGGNPLSFTDPDGLQRRPGGAPVIPLFPRIGPTLPPANPQVGTTRNPIEIRRGTNSPGEFGGVPFSGHAFDRTQGRGIPPSVVINTIFNGRPSPG